MNKLEWYEKTADIILDDIENFYSQFYQNELTPLGKQYRLEPCPICGHGGCCTIGAAVYCFSCSWSGTHITAWYEYAKGKGMSLEKAISRLDEFTKLKFPSESKEDFEAYLKNQREQEILKIAEDFYHKQLLNCVKKYPYKDISVTPLEYMIEVRKRKVETLKDFKFGFSSNFPQLRMDLKEAGFTDEEIKNAKVWVPEDLFVFIYKHPSTKDIVRINTKNPFLVKGKTFNEFHQEILGDVIQGYSTGNKVFLFSPNFTFKKPFAIVEGEHDLASMYEDECKNICCIGGNVSDETFDCLDKATNSIYAAFDNDLKGMEYLERINKLFPEKHLYEIVYPKEYNDPDECFVAGALKPWKALMKEATLLKTEEFKIKSDRRTWQIVNRYKKLEFQIKGRSDKGHITGQANLYEGGKLIERDDGISLIKCKTKMRPMNFLLSDAIDIYHNKDFDSKSVDELMEIYWYSAKKQDIINVIAKKIYDSPQKQEDTIQKLKLRFKTFDETGEVIDTILKEINDLQNKSVSKFSAIPRIKLSQYFNVRNNDAYMYFTYVKDDGDARRKLPFLLRNDGVLIRLDLLKRKDLQCLLLIDNKYELPFEIPNAIFELDDCSLNQEAVEQYISGNLPKEELDPAYLVKTIENYIKRFYYTNDENTYKLLALYCYTTYYYELFGQMPYLYLNGEKGSGKSVLDSTLKMFCFNAKLAVDITEAALFRMTAVDGGTIILDEMENLTSRQKTSQSTMAAILKGGYTRDNPVWRTNMEKGGILDRFDTYGPKIISNIFGLEDIIADRCIEISTYRLIVTKDTRKEDPRNYYMEYTDDIKSVTSRCSISALENFIKVNEIYKRNTFESNNARLTQILTPILAIAKLVDLPELEMLKQKLPDAHESTLVGEYESALIKFYENVIKFAKADTEQSTPEGIIKKVLPVIARELSGLVLKKDLEYSISHTHKYREAIKYNKEQGWFELNVLHFKCFIEENLPGDIAYCRIIPRWLKTCFNFEKQDIKRRTAVIEQEDLIKEFKGVTHPKVNTYRFYFKDFISNDFLTAPATEEPVEAQESSIASGEKLF